MKLIARHTKITGPEAKSADGLVYAAALNPNKASGITVPNINDTINMMRPFLISPAYAIPKPGKKKEIINPNAIFAIFFHLLKNP